MNPEDIPTSELLHEYEWRKCAPQSKNPDVLFEGLKYFCHKYWHIKHPEHGRISFDLYDAQEETFKLWLSSRYSLMLKARQLGFSTLVATFAFWNAFFYEDRPIVMLSRTERDAVKLLAKSKYGYRFLPEWMKFRGPPVNMTQTKMEFANESYIESLPSMNDPARGESVYLAVIDELAYLPNSEEAWASIEPIADVGGRVIALSTANGEGNLFHKLWVGAETGNNRFKHMFHPWNANGRTQDWYEEKKADLPDWQMAQEYPDNPEDAFLRSGRPVFNLETLRAIECHSPLTKGHFVEVMAGRFEFRDQDGGPLSVWVWPNDNHRYCIGADVAQGLEHGDFSSAHVIDSRTGEVVAHWHGRIDPDLFGTDVLVPLGEMYGNALIGVESNNHGLTTLKALSRSRYHPIYMQRSPRYKKSVPTDILGWRTTQVTKPVAVDELARNIRDGTVKLYCAETVAELRTFVYDETNKMKGSPYDDRTMSLVIANDMIKYVWRKEYEPPKVPDPYSFAWWEKRLYGDIALGHEINLPKLEEPEPIGQHFVRRT